MIFRAVLGAASKEFIGEQPAEMPDVANLFGEIEFAFTKLAIREVDGDFTDIAASAFHEQFEPDLVSDGIECLGFGEAGSAEGEESAHWVLGRGKGACEGGCNFTVYPAEEAPVFVCCRSRDISTADDEVRAFVEGAQHVGDTFWRVAEICVHDEEDIFCCGLETVDDGGAQASIAGAYDEFDPWPCFARNDGRGIVRAGIVHNEKFQVEACVFTHGVNARQKVGKVFRLFVGWDDDGNGRCHGSFQSCQ